MVPGGPAGVTTPAAASADQKSNAPLVVVVVGGVDAGGEAVGGGGGGGDAAVTGNGGADDGNEGGINVGNSVGKSGDGGTGVGIVDEIATLGDDSSSTISDGIAETAAASTSICEDAAGGATGDGGGGIGAAPLSPPSPPSASGVSGGGSTRPIGGTSAPSVVIRRCWGPLVFVFRRRLKYALQAFAVPPEAPFSRLWLGIGGGR